VERWALASFHALSRLWISVVSKAFASVPGGAHLYWSPGRPSGRFDTLNS
jgi:hypothetical protein